MAHFPLVSVVVPVFNDGERLKRCLECLEHQTYPSDRYEVLIVDNGSNPPIEATVPASERVTVVAESRPGSYAARNRGIGHAKGEVIALTDADCLPMPDWIEQGVTKLMATPDCGLVGGKIEFSFQKADQPTGIEHYDRLSYLRQQDYIEQFHFAATANVLTYRRVFSVVGLFDADLKSVGDRDWGKRVYAAGYRQVYAADACVEHPARHTYRQVLKKIVRVAKGSYALALKKEDFRNVFISNLGGSLKPPFRLFFRVWIDPELPRLNHKLEYVALVIVEKYITAWYQMKLVVAQRLRLRTMPAADASCSPDRSPDGASDGSPDQSSALELR